MTTINYVIYMQGKMIKAVNEDTGNIDYISTDAVKVINSVISSLKIRGIGGKIFIKEGNYHGTGQIIVAANIEICGTKETILNGIGINIIGDHVTLRNIEFVGDPTFAQIFIEANHINVISCNAYDIGPSYDGIFRIHAADNTTLSDILFQDCKVEDCGRIGFYVTGNYKNNANVIDTTFLRCQAIACGKMSKRYNDWVVGFDIVDAPGPNLDNIKLIDCTSAQSWQSGFHMENVGSQKNIFFIRCLSENNGQKQLADFGNGFILHDNVHLINCISRYNNGGTVNSGCGIYVVDGRNIDINSCSIENNSGRSILLEGTSYGILTDNNIVGGDVNILCESNCSNIIISKNICIDAMSNGIQVSYGSIVDDNIVDNSRVHGIIIPSMANNCNICTNNILSSHVNGIDINSGYNNVADNILFGSSANSIACESTSNNNFVDRNYVDKCILDVGVSNKICSNKGHVTENNVLSETFAIDTTGVKTVTIAHGLAIMPAVQDCYLMVVQDTVVDDWAYNMLKIVSTNANNVIAKISVSIASDTVGATAKLSLMVGNVYL